MPILPRCFLCNEAEETKSHLFSHCKFTSQLWAVFSALLKSTGPCLNILQTYWVAGLEWSKSRKKGWRVILACIWWTVWKERSGRCSENRFNFVEKVKWKWIVSFYFWYKEQCMEKVDDLVDLSFIRSPVISFICLLLVSLLFWMWPTLKCWGIQQYQFISKIKGVRVLHFDNVELKRLKWH